MIHWHLNQVDQLKFYYDRVIVYYKLNWQLSAGTHQILVQGLSPYLMLEHLHHDLLEGESVTDFQAHIIQNSTTTTKDFHHIQQQEAYQRWQESVDQYQVAKSMESRIDEQLQHWLRLIELGEIESDEWRRGYLKLDQEMQGRVVRRVKADWLQKQRYIDYQNTKQTPKPLDPTPPALLCNITLQDTDTVEVRLSYHIDRALWRAQHHFYINATTPSTHSTMISTTIPRTPVTLDWLFYAHVWQDTKEDWKRAESLFFPCFYDKDIASQNQLYPTRTNLQTIPLAPQNDTSSTDTVSTFPMQHEIRVSSSSLLRFDCDKVFNTKSVSTVLHSPQKTSVTKDTQPSAFTLNQNINSTFQTLGDQEQRKQDHKLSTILRFMSPRAENYLSQNKTQTLVLHQEKIEAELLIQVDLQNTHVFWVLEGTFNTLLPLLSAPTLINLQGMDLGIHEQPSVNLDQNFQFNIGLHEDLYVVMLQRQIQNKEVVYNNEDDSEGSVRRSLVDRSINPSSDQSIDPSPTHYSTQYNTELHFRVYNTCNHTVCIQLNESIALDETPIASKSKSSETHIEIDVTYAQQNLFSLTTDPSMTDAQEALTWSWNSNHRTLSRWLHLPAHTYSEEIMIYQYKKITSELA